MAIEYNFTVNGDHLLVKASGKDGNLEEVMAYGMGIVETALKNNTKFILCDERELEYGLDTFDNFQSAEHIANLVPGLAKVAIVHQEKGTEQAEFWETVAVNRGLQVCMFKDMETAEKWLDIQKK